MAELLFLSHSSTDKPLLRPLVEALKGLGVGVWFDEERIVLAEPIPRAISGGLDNSNRLLGAWSRAAAASHHVSNELDAFYMSHPESGSMLFLLLDGTPLPTLHSARKAIRLTDVISNAQEIAAWFHGDTVATASPSATQPSPELELQLIPRGPAVPTHWITTPITRAFARLAGNNPRHREVIEEAIRIRERADPHDPHRTAISMGELPSIGAVGADAFWSETFYVATRHGPRMVAALLLALRDDQFDTAARHDRAALLIKLRLMGQWQ